MSKDIKKTIEVLERIYNNPDSYGCSGVTADAFKHALEVLKREEGGEMKNIEILGVAHKVTIGHLRTLIGSGNSGLCEILHQQIFIDTDQSIERQRATLLHEIIEAVNNMLELDLPHEKISQLEVGIYSAIKDDWNPKMKELHNE